jgi:hypothetical protein
MATIAGEGDGVVEGRRKMNEASTVEHDTQQSHTDCNTTWYCCCCCCCCCEIYLALNQKVEQVVDVMMIDD